MRLHVHEWGPRDGRTLACLHGVGDTAELFRRLAVEALPSFRVLAPDLRGHGASGREPPWDVETHVADVLETIDPPDGWIGHSFGGRLVIELAARHPELVPRAVLLDPAIRLRPDNALRLAEEHRQREDPSYCQSAAVAVLGALAGPHAPVDALRVPTLLVVPERDPVVGPRQLERFRRAAGDLLRVERVDAGHWTLTEAFDDVAAVVSDFLLPPREEEL